MGQTVPEPYGSIVDAACECDRLYFEEYLEAREYTRPYVFGEFYPFFPEVETVLVRRIARDVRTRAPVTEPRGLN